MVQAALILKRAMTISGWRTWQASYACRLSSLAVPEAPFFSPGLTWTCGQVNSPPF